MQKKFFFRKITSHLLLITLIAVVFFNLGITQARAQTAGNWTGACVGSTTNTTDVATIQGAECLVANVLDAVMTLLGIAAFVMFLVGGFRYLTAGTNSKGMEAGRNSLTFAIIGIVVALASIVVIKIVTSFTGISPTRFLQFNTQVQNVK